MDATAPGPVEELLLDGFSRLIDDQPEISALGVLVDLSADRLALTAQTRAGEVAARLHQGAEYIAESADPDQTPRLDPRLHKLRTEATFLLNSGRVRDCVPRLGAALQELLDTGALDRLAPGAVVVLAITGSDEDTDQIRVLTRPERM